MKSDQNLIDAFEHFVLEDCEDIKMSRTLKATLSRCTQYSNTQYSFLVYTCIRGKGGAVHEEPHAVKFLSRNLIS